MDAPRSAFAAVWVQRFAVDQHGQELTNEHLLQAEVAETIDPSVLAGGFEIDKTFKLGDWVKVGNHCPAREAQTSDFPVFPTDFVPDLSKSSFQPCTEIIRIASHASTPAAPVPGHRQTSPPVTFVNCSPGQHEEFTRQPAKSICRSLEPASVRTRSGTTPVASVHDQNDPLGASVSVSCSVPAIDPQDPAWDDFLDHSAVVPVDYAKFANQNDSPYAFELAPVCSDQPAPVAHAASVPVNLLEAAREHCILDYHGLENTQFTLEGIESFVGAGHTDHLQFSSLEEASNAHLSDASPHDDDPTLPRDTRLKKVYVWLLCVALHSVQYAVDVSETAKGLSLPNGFKTAMMQGSIVELCAWQMLERLTQQHTANPARAAGSIKHFATFLDRFNAVVTLFMQRKGLSKRLLETPFIDQVAGDPALVLQRVLSNESTNARKKAQIAAGQAALAAQEGEWDAKTTKPRAPRKRKNPGTDGAKGPASKRTRA